MKHACFEVGQLLPGRFQTKLIARSLLVPTILEFVVFEGLSQGGNFFLKVLDEAASQTRVAPA